MVREVTYETGRMLRTMLEGDPDLASHMKKVRVFLSHSKHDDFGERVARRIRDWLHDDVQLSVFLDIVDIPAGLPPDDVLEKEVRRSAVLVVYSDSFSSREWCGREVLVAKESDRPIVVADCIEDLDERAFPISPTCRWCASVLGNPTASSESLAAFSTRSSRTSFGGAARYLLTKPTRS